MHDWSIYALGGGMGHLQRALALARAARRRGCATEILTNSPWAGRLPPSSRWLSGIRVHRIPPGASASETEERVIRFLENRRDATLIVDTFPRGLAGELAGLLPGRDGPSVFVHREIDPVYWRRFPCAQAAKLYDLILLPGEGGRLLDEALPTRRTNPWLLLDAEELASREDARLALGVPFDRRPLVAVAHAGRPGESHLLRDAVDAAARRLPATHQVCLTPAGHSGTLRWPLLEWLPGVDVVVGGGGYQTVHECRATGTPLIGFAWPRLYDRQAERLTAEELVADSGELAARLADLLESATGRRSSGTKRPAYRNGAHEAVEAILRIERSRNGPPDPTVGSVRDGCSDREPISPSGRARSVATGG